MSFFVLRLTTKNVKFRGYIVEDDMGEISISIGDVWIVDGCLCAGHHVLS